jgi:ABC-type amino acid transport substrate-binding protein
MRTLNYFYTLLLASLGVFCTLTPADASTFVLGRDPYWTPLSFGEKTADVTAFSDKVIEGIAESEKTQINIIDVSYEGLFNLLDRGCVDGILTTLEPNPENLTQYNFSTPFFLAGPVLVVRADSSATHLSDLKGKVVSINAYDNTVLLVQKYSTIVIKNYTNIPQALEDLANGYTDAALIPTVQAHSIINALYPKRLKIASPPLNNDSLKLVTLKGKQRPLLLTFHRGLKKIKKAGLYTLLRLEYNVN